MARGGHWCGEVGCRIETERSGVLDRAVPQVQGQVERRRHRGSTRVRCRDATEYRRELAWSHRGRRGRKADPEWAQRCRMVRAAETLSDEESAKVHDAMHAADPSGGLEKCWQGKEMLPAATRTGRHGTGPEPDLDQVDRLLHVLRRLRGRPAPPARVDRARLATIDHRRPDHRHQQRPHRGLQPHRQTCREVGRIAFGFRSTENHKTPDTIRLNPRITPGANQSPQALLMPKSRQMGHPIAMRRALVRAAVINEGHRRDGVPTLAGLSRRAALGAFAGPSRPNAVPAPRVRIGWAPL